MHVYKLELNVKTEIWSVENSVWHAGGKKIICKKFMKKIKTSMFTNIKKLIYIYNTLPTPAHIKNEHTKQQYE